MTTTGRRGWVGVDRRWLADDRLSDSALRLMMWLDSHTHEYLRDLSARRIADEIGWSRDRVKRTLDKLEELDLITVKLVPLPSGGKRTFIVLDIGLWTDQSAALPQGHARPHDEAAARPYDEATTTSTTTVSTQPLGESLVFDSDATPEARLCHLLADAIEADGGRRPTITEAWVTDMERLIRLDERTPEQIAAVIRWLATGKDQTALFWRPNIRSPKKLREKWDQMAAQYKSRQTVARPESTTDRIKRARQGQDT